MSTLDAYLRHHASTRGGSLAVAGEEERLTYAELEGEVERWARALLAYGISAGDVVAVLGWSRPECVLAFLAVCRVGAVFLGLSPKHTIRELSYVLSDSAPRLLLALHGRHEAEQDEKLRALKTDAVSVVSRGGAVRGLSEALEDFLARAAGASSEAAPVADPEAACAIVYTSGSTGPPKGALLSQRGMIRSAAITWQHWYGALDPLRTVAQHPINHVGWLVCECVTTLLPGGSMFCRERFNGAETLQLIERERLNLWLAFPSMLMLAMETPQFRSCDLTSLDTIALGMPASVELMRAYRERTGAVMCVSYGLTEASGGAVTVTARDAPLEVIATTIGRALPGVEIRVDGGGEEGELLVRDPCLFLGYLNLPESTAEALDADGWLHTGDIVREAADGELRMVGRRKEMFKSGGYNVYPTEVEGVLGGHDSVGAVAVVEMPDPLWDEVGVAFVIPKEGARVGEAELRAYAQQRLANYKVPKRILLVDSLPQLPNGKFDKVGLRAQARDLLQTSSGTGDVSVNQRRPEPS